MTQKPTQKGVLSAATKVGAGVVGAKVSDGIVSVLPESTKKYNKAGLAVASIVAAACINPKTAAGEAAQAALIGMGVKQGADALSEVLVPTIAPKDNADITGRFVNGVVGHDTTAPVSTTAASTERAALNAAYRRKKRLASPVDFETANPVKEKVTLGV